MASKVETITDKFPIYIAIPHVIAFLFNSSKTCMAHEV